MIEEFQDVAATLGCLFHQTIPRMYRIGWIGKIIITKLLYWEYLCLIIKKDTIESIHGTPTSAPTWIYGIYFWTIFIVNLAFTRCNQNSSKVNESMQFGMVVGTINAVFLSYFNLILNPKSTKLRNVTLAVT